MQGDYTPAIRISKSDFQIFSKGKTTLEKQDFIDRMRDQLESYVRSRLSSTSEFWRDEPYDYNTAGPLKHLLMEQYKMRHQIQQLLRALYVPNTDSSDVYSEGILNNAQPVGVEIRAMGERLLQLVSEESAECLDEQLCFIGERLNQLRAAVCQFPGGAPPCVASAPQSPPSKVSIPGSPLSRDWGSHGNRDGDCPKSPVVKDTAMPKAQSPTCTLQSAPMPRTKTKLGRPKADRSREAGGQGGLRILCSTTFRAIETAGSSGLAAAAVLPQTFRKDGAARDGVGAPTIRCAAARDGSHLLPMLDQRFWSEGGYGKNWGRRDEGVHSNCAVSLHSQVPQGDVVLIGYPPRGRCGHGPDAGIRSDLFDSEPALL
jgi:hypothetical protein